MHPRITARSVWYVFVGSYVCSDRFLVYLLVLSGVDIVQCLLSVVVGVLSGYVSVKRVWCIVNCYCGCWIDHT